MIKVFYGDGNTFEGPANEAPRLNVQAIICPDTSLQGYQVGTLCLRGWDYYLFRKDRGWYGINGEADLVDHVLFETPEVVLKGRMIRNDLYQEILAEAMKGKKNFNPTVEDGRK